MTVQMVAIARFNHNKRSILVGENFEANDDADADDLEAVRMARRVAKAKPAVAPVVKPEPAAVVTRELTAEESATAATEEKSDTSDDGSSTDSSGQGKYNRRDMRAKR